MIEHNDSARTNFTHARPQGAGAGGGGSSRDAAVLELREGARRRARGMRWTHVAALAALVVALQAANECRDAPPPTGAATTLHCRAANLSRLPPLPTTLLIL